MTVRLLFFILISFGCLDAQAQFKSKLGGKKAKAETEQTDGSKSELKRPMPTGNAVVDRFVSETFKSFENVQKIQRDATFVKVNITEVEDQGDGVTTEMTITNGRNEAVTPKNALKQLAALALRVEAEKANLQNIINLKTPAANALAEMPLKTKMAGSRAYKTAIKAEGRLASETKTLLQVLNNQMATIKSLM